MNHSELPFLTIVACGLVSVSLFAQTDDSAASAASSGGVTSPTATELALPGPVATSQHQHDGITLLAGKVMITRNGVTSPLDKEMTLPNGIHVRPDGSMIGMDSAPLALRADQTLGFDGNITPRQTTTAPPQSAAAAEVGGAKAGGTAAVNQAAAELGEAEAQRRTKVAIDTAAAPDPNSSAK